MRIFARFWSYFRRGFYGKLGPLKNQSYQSGGSAFENCIFTYFPYHLSPLFSETVIVFITMRIICSLDIICSTVFLLGMILLVGTQWLKITD